MKTNVLTSEELYMLASSLTIIMKSGIPLSEGFQMLEEEYQTGQIQQVCKKTQASLALGNPLYQAMQESESFPLYMTHMIELGETCGCLDIVCKELADYYEREADLKNQLKHAVSFPLVLLVMMFLVLAILLFKVLPIFQNVLHSLGSELSTFALGFMNFGNLLATGGFYILLVVLCVIILSLLFQKRKNNMEHPFLETFFLTKHLYQGITMAKITYAFSLFLASGSNMEEALEFVPQLIGHSAIKKRLATCQIAYHTGNNFAQSLKSSELYEGLSLSMLEVGFRSGHGDEVMHQLADTYEKKVEDEIANFLNVLEPTIVAVLSVLVGIILLSVMMPLMSIMSSL